MEETENETEKNTYRRLLETYEKTVSDDETPPDESVIHNRELLAEYENALDTLGIELSKWETREGQAAEKVRELDRDLEAMASGKER